MNKVIVIISTYNGSENIERQLDSIYAQKEVSVSVFIRDDHSTDNTVDIILAYKMLHPNYRLSIMQGDNVGYATSFWIALKNCGDADFYAFSDQDDLWKEDKLIRCINAMETGNSEIPMLSYSKMQRSDKYLMRLDEQVKVLKPTQLSKKLVLTKTYNYGAATLINAKAKELVCRCWPEIDSLPHDMWTGIICYWFGKIYYINDDLYYWIRYENSVTGEGTQKSGKMYRIRQSMKKKSYPNVSKFLYNSYSELLSQKDKRFLEYIIDYKKNIYYKLMLLFDFRFHRGCFGGTLALKLGILLNWF